MLSQYEFELDVEGNEILIGSVDSPRFIIRRILSESNEPLHYSEIVRRCLNVIKKRRSPNTIKNIISEECIYLGRGIYGTYSHLRIPEEEQIELLSVLDNIIDSDIQRQWSCEELLKIINENYEHIKFPLNKYTINAILNKASNLKYLGRLVWVHKDALNLTSRSEIMDLAVKLIREAGRPLNSTEIFREIKKYRGLGIHVQLHSNNHISRIGRDLWGLLNWDFILDENQILALREKMVTLLEERQKGIHRSELNDLILNKDLNFPNDFNVDMAIGIALPDNRFKLTRDQILYLSKWGDPRRLSFKEALTLLLYNIESPITTEGMRHKLEVIMERKLDSAKVSSGLYASKEFDYDHEGGVWQLKRTPRVSSSSKESTRTTNAIKQLENRGANNQPPNISSTSPNHRVDVGDKVTILDLDDHKEYRYSITSTHFKFPVENALIGRVVGDIVDIRAHSGNRKIKILEINKL